MRHGRLVSSSVTIYVWLRLYLANENENSLFADRVTTCMNVSMYTKV